MCHCFTSDILSLFTIFSFLETSSISESTSTTRANKIKIYNVYVCLIYYRYTASSSSIIDTFPIFPPSILLNCIQLVFDTFFGKLSRSSLPRWSLLVWSIASPSIHLSCYDVPWYLVILLLDVAFADTVPKRNVICPDRFKDFIAKKQFIISREFGISIRQFNFSYFILISFLFVMYSAAELVESHIQVFF